MNKTKGSRKNQRKRQRFPFQTEVSITVSNSIQLQGELSNISISGLFVLTEMKLGIGTECKVDIRIFDKGNQISLSIIGKVVRQDSEGIGIAFFNELELWCLGCVLSGNSNMEESHESGTKARDKFLMVA